MIALFSIMHTGTLFTKELLCDYKFFVVGQEIPLDRVDNPAIFEHITEGAINGIEKLVRLHKTVVPLRHPCRVRESWARRYKNIDRLSDLDKVWKILIDRIDSDEIVYISIDSENRNEMLLAASLSLGLELKTDWSICHSVADTSAIDITDEMIAKEPKWIMDFYLGKINANKH